MRAVALVAVMLTGLLGAVPATAQTDHHIIVDRAALTVRDMPYEAELPAMIEAMQRARAVFVAPSIYKGGFFVGGEGGRGIIVARLPDGSWSAPAFMDVAAGSFGLQIGGQVSRTVIAIMTDEGLDAILSDRFTIGAEVGVAMVSVGAGVGAQTGLDWNADMYTFTDNKGLFIGAGLEGSVILEDADAALEYYGRHVTAREILEGRVFSPHADGLRSVLPAPRATAAGSPTPTGGQGAPAPVGTVTVQTLN